MLQIANAAVNHLEALGGGRAPEVRTLDQGSAQAAQRRVVRGGCAECSCANDQNVELSFDEARRIALHAIHLGNDNACNACSVPGSRQEFMYSHTAARRRARNSYTLAGVMVASEVVTFASPLRRAYMLELARASLADDT
jgi:hypothetical protein